MAPFVLGRKVRSLLKATPNFEIEVAATDRLVDIVEDGFDAGIRLGATA